MNPPPKEESLDYLRSTLAVLIVFVCALALLATLIPIADRTSTYVEEGESSCAPIGSEVG